MNSVVSVSLEISTNLVKLIFIFVIGHIGMLRHVVKIVRNTLQTSGNLEPLPYVLIILL